METLHEIISRNGIVINSSIPLFFDFFPPNPAEYVLLALSFRILTQKASPGLHLVPAVLFGPV